MRNHLVTAAASALIGSVIAAASRSRPYPRAADAGPGNVVALRAREPQVLWLSAHPAP